MAGEGEEKQDVQTRIERALFSRLPYFKENDSTITMVSVRRLIEEDLGFEKYALDEHKKFIKQFIEENLYCDDGGSKNSEENVRNNSDSIAIEVRESPIRHEKDKDLTEPTFKDEPDMEEGSPIMGLLTTKGETVSPQAIEASESTIKKAIWERAGHIRANSEVLTLARARRLLEEDLGLHKNALESFKKFIRKQIEEVLEPPKVSKSDMGHKKEGSRSRPSGEGRSGSKDGPKIEVEDTAEPREKAKVEKSNRLKRSRTENGHNNSGKKHTIAKKQTEEDSEAENDGGLSEDGGSQSCAEKSAKKKPISTPVNGKHVEHLKSIIKACGMSVPPSVYKKVKQVPDNKRESFLTKELEGILSKEGVSSNATEKEIKEVRKRKERAKELEGIDISNIVTSSRRRSSSSFMPPTQKRQDDGSDNANGTKKANDGRKNDAEKDKNEARKEEEEEEKEEEKEEEEEEEEEEDNDDDPDDSENEEFNEEENDSD